MEHIEPNWELFARIAMRRFEGYVAGSCYAGERQWFGGNVCRIQKKLNR